MTNTTTNKTTKNHEAITLENVQTIAVKAAYHTIKLLDSLSGTTTTRQLLNGFAHLTGVKTAKNKKQHIAKHYLKDDKGHYIKDSDGKKIIDHIEKRIIEDNSIIISQSSDTDDLVNEAALALLENMDNENAFQLACKAVRQYVYAQSNNRGQYKHMYIEDYTGTNENGEPITDIIDVNNGISALLKRIDNQSIISSIVSALSPTQKRILHYISLGYTNITISKRLGISDKTVSVHIARIRAKARELYPDFAI